MIIKSDFLQELRQSFRELPFFWMAILGVCVVPLFSLPLSAEVSKVALFTIFSGLVLWSARRDKLLYTLPLWFAVGLAVFLLWVGLSTLHDDNTWQAVLGRYSRFNNSVLLFSAWSVFVLVLTLGWRRVNERLPLHFMLVVATAVALFGILQALGVGFFAGIQEFIAPQFNRTPSFLGNPNFSALLVATLWPIGVLLGFTSRSRWGFWYGVTSSSLMLFSLGIFASRGALLGAVAGLLALLPFFYRRFGVRKLLGVVSTFAVLVTVAFFWAQLFHPGVQAGISGAEQNVVTRFYAWSESLLMMDRNIWFGVGPGGFLSDYMQNAVDPLMPEGWFDDPHNWFLHLGTTLGLPGLLVFASFIGLIILYAGKYAWRKETSSISAIIGFAGLFSFLTASMFSPITVSLWCIFAVLVACSMRGEDVTEFVISELYLVRFNVLRRGLGVLGLLLIILGGCWFVGDYATSTAGMNFRRQNKERAQVYAKLARAVWPTQYTAQLMLAVNAVSSDQDWQVAQRKLQQIGVRYPQDPIVHLQIARVWWMRADVTKDERDTVIAKAYAKQAFELTPKVSEPLVVLGYFELSQGNRATAQRLLEQALVIEPNNIMTWQLLSTIYQQENNREAMIRSLHKLVQLRPHSKQFKQARDAAIAGTGVSGVNLQVGKLEVYF